MMRTVLLSLVAVALALTAGCAQKTDLEDIACNTAEADGLKLQVELPGRNFQTGDALRVTVTATNTTRKPIEIHSPTGAPVLVRITRYDMLSPEQVRVYPRTATANILSWTLPPGQSRTFVMMVPIEPDWPVEEVLYLSAELNGYEKVAPRVFLLVHKPRDD